MSWGYGHMKTALVVEDETNILYAIIDQLLDLGLKAIPADTYERASEAIETDHCLDFILFDGRLNDGRQSIDLIQRARERFPHCRLVAMSTDLREAQMASGCDYEADKPLVCGLVLELMNVAS